MYCTCTIHSHSMRIFDQSSYQYYLCYEGSYISDHNRHARVSKSIFVFKKSNNLIIYHHKITQTYYLKKHLMHNKYFYLVPNARKCQKRVKYPFSYAHKDRSQPSPNNLYECDMKRRAHIYFYSLFLFLVDGRFLALDHRPWTSVGHNNPNRRTNFEPWRSKVCEKMLHYGMDD